MPAKIWETKDMQENGRPMNREISVFEAYEILKNVHREYAKISITLLKTAIETYFE
jgi:hypothetical protein